jgi:hypothetical protein
MNTDNIKREYEEYKSTLLHYVKHWGPSHYEKLVTAAQEGKWETVGEICQTVWDELPDSKMIHQAGFYHLCNIAEEYCFGDEYND